MLQESLTKQFYNIQIKKGRKKIKGGGGEIRKGAEDEREGTTGA